MRNQPLPLIGQFYTDDAHPWAMQDVCNYLPCAAETEGTRTATKCTTPPGLAPFVETGSSSAVRGLYNANGRLFGVIGAAFYEFTTTGVAVPRGTVGGASRVRMAHNQQTHGNELILVNGSAGYLYNTQTQVFGAITDDGYPGAIDVVFIDGYFVQIDPSRRFAFCSDVAAGGDYNTLDRFTSEVSPDPLVGLAAPNNELVLFSETSTEFFENTGSAQQPFRSKRISMKRGAASRYGQAELDNTVFWLGNDGKFYVLEGYAPKRISTRPIEQAIRGCNWSQAFAHVWESEGHAVVYWTFPDGRTWGYDASQGRWHRRASYGLDRWRVNCTAFWEDRWIAGDFQRGRLWELDWGYPWEYQTEFVSEIVAPVIHDHQNRVLMPRLEILMDVGQPEVAVREFDAQPEPPDIEPMAEGAPIGLVGTPYNAPIGYQWEITPGTAPIAGVELREGTLADGLTMDGDSGDITGTPTEAGEFPMTARVTDTNELWDEAEDSIRVVYPMFAAVDNLLTLQKSSQAGDDDFPDTVATGLTTTTSTVCVGSAGGALFHFGAGTEGRVSTDPTSTTWTACTGLSSLSGFNPGDGNLIQVGVEWQLYHWGLHVSDDGIAWTERTISSGTHDAVQRPVARGSTVLAVAAQNVLNVSTDAGNTFTEYTIAAFNTSEGVQRLRDTGTTFYAFGRDASTGELLIGRSTTGLSGSWTTTAGPEASICHGAAYNPTTGRLAIVLQNGNTWVCDNPDAATPLWTAGDAVPYGGALTYPPLQDNNMICTNGLFFFCAPQGGGVNRIYCSIDGVSVWAYVYTNSSSNAVNSVTGHNPYE
jgi:hypothetical protein